MTGALRKDSMFGGSSVGPSDGERQSQIREVRDTILLVEDEVLVRMVLADTLRDAGYTVIEASNAHEALQILNVDSDVVRVIISDVRMPGSLDGVGLAGRVRAEYPAIKIVLTSGDHKEVGWVEHDGFFPKPCDSDALIQHIKTLLG
jgi:CheY-like chemotaxis protein